MSARWRAVLCGVCGLMFAAGASAETVTDTVKLTLSADAELTLSTIAVDGYPTDIGSPAFWFDASATNGWSFHSSGAVTNIPSKVGARSLQFRPAGASWDGWGDWKPARPGYVGGDFPYVDFGELGSRKALVFNAVDVDGTTKNALTDIGTIVAVVKGGGAWVMGGGATSTIEWHRGLFHNKTDIEKFDYSNPLLHSNNAKQVVREAMARHNGAQSSVYTCGWTGEWEVFSYCPLAVGGSATGIGVGDARANMQARSGGQQIAEMLIFDKVLSESDVRRVEAWLLGKWFARAVCGYGGAARIGSLRLYGATDTPISATVLPSAGETLRVDRVTGGFDGSPSANPEVRMSGVGAFEPRMMATYNGTVRATSGTLKLGRRAVPTLEQLPSGCYLRFDVSEAASREVTAGGEIVALTNLAVGTFAEYGKANPYLKSGSDTQRPTLRTNATATGLSVADFGKSIYYNGDYMTLRAGENAVAANGITTMIALLGGENDGGHLLNGSFTRNGALPAYGTSHVGLIQPGSTCGYEGKTPTVPVTNGMIVVDGIRRMATSGLSHWGYQAVAVQVPGCFTLNEFGRGIINGSYYCGGAVLGEMLVYNRQLTEEEICDVQAYLSQKWLGKTLPGYVAVADVPDVQAVVADGEAMIDVQEGTVARLGKLNVPGKLVKTGAGTLKVDSASASGELVVRDGRLAVTGPGEPASASSLAAGPSLHLDASLASSLTTETINGTNYVTIWRDDASGNQARSYAIGWSGNRRPFVTPGDERLNGLNTIDFGTYQGGGDSSNTSNGKGCYLHFTESLESVRSVFIVSRFKSGNAAGPILGNSNQNGEASRISFIRGNNGELIYQTGATCAPVRNGEILTNGVAVASSVPPGNDFVLTELHPTAGMHASALCVDRWNSASYVGVGRGGQVIAEVVIYERELSAREKVATRNYLMKKWFDRDPEPLPAKPAVVPVPYVLENLVADGNAAAGLDLTDADVTIPQNPVVRLANLPADPQDGDTIVLFTANSISSGENLRNATFVGETLPEGKVLRIRRRGNSVVAIFGQTGLVLIVR